MFDKNFEKNKKFDIKKSIFIQLILIMLIQIVLLFMPEITLDNPSSSVSNAATSQSFSYTGNVQSYTVPTNGIYKLDVYGAKGTTYYRLCGWKWWTLYRI